MCCPCAGHLLRQFEGMMMELVEAAKHSMDTRRADMAALALAPPLCPGPAEQARQFVTGQLRRRIGLRLQERGLWEAGLQGLALGGTAVLVAATLCRVVTVAARRAEC
jgi:hypothetical protein